MANFKSWYHKNKRDYEDFVIVIGSLIEDLLRTKNVQYLLVQYRVKDLKGFLNKMRLQKGKKDPYKTNDLACLRVICYLTSDIEPIKKKIKANFEVLNIDNKSEGLAVDKMGYKALHIDGFADRVKSKASRI